MDIVNIQDSDGTTPLIIAARKQNIMAVRELIRAGANLNIQNKYGITALIAAVDEQNIDIVRELLRAGANPDLKNGDGDTALMYAACLNIDLVRELIEAGANVNLVNNKTTALLKAIKRKNVEITTALLEAGAHKKYIKNKKDIKFLDDLFKKEKNTLEAMFSYSKGGNIYNPLVPLNQFYHNVDDADKMIKDVLSYAYGIDKGKKSVKRRRSKSASRRK